MERLDAAVLLPREAVPFAEAPPERPLVPRAPLPPDDVPRVVVLPRALPAAPDAPLFPADDCFPRDDADVPSDRALEPLLAPDLLRDDLDVVAIGELLS